MIIVDLFALPLLKIIPDVAATRDVIHATFTISALEEAFNVNIHLYAHENGRLSVLHYRSHYSREIYCPRAQSFLGPH